MFGPEYNRVLAFTSKDGDLVCIDCVTNEQRMESLTEAMLDSYVSIEDGEVYRPTCDNCFRQYSIARGWLDASEMEATCEDGELLDEEGGDSETA